MTEGEQLRLFIDNQAKSKVRIASDLGMSKQNLFGLFKSQYLTDETKQKMEEYFGSKIFEPMPANGQVVKVDQKAPPPDENYTRLVRSMENLTEDKIRSTAIIERLVALLEQGFSYGQTGKSAAAQAENSKPADDPAFGDFALDKRMRRANKNNQ